MRIMRGWRTTVGIASSGAIALALCACSTAGSGATTTAGATTSSAAVATTKHHAPPPACESAWLSLKITNVVAVSGGSGGALTSHDVLSVTTTTRCALSGWPTISGVPASGYNNTGARPAIDETRSGTSRTVVVSPSRPAVVHLRVRVPRKSAWPGGNICAAGISALATVPEGGTPTLVNLPSHFVYCGASGPIPVRVSPYRLPSASSAGTTRTTSTRSGGSSPSSAVSVPFRALEVSVPGSWWVAYNGSVGCIAPAPAGQVMLGAEKEPSACSAAPPKTTIHLFSIARVPPKYAHEHPTDVNGVPVIIGQDLPHHLTYFVPSAKEAMRATGPEASTIAATLSWSPRHELAVLTSHPQAPSSWQKLDYAGLAVSVPGSWTVTRTNVRDEPLCGSDEPSLPADQVLLDSDRTTEYPPCPYFPPTATVLFGSGGAGLRIDRHPNLVSSGRSHLNLCRRIHTLWVCAYGHPAMASLVLRVSEGGLAHPRLVWLGLGTDTTELAEVIDSLAPARAAA